MQHRDGFSSETETSPPALMGGKEAKATGKKTESLKREEDDSCPRSFSRFEHG